VSARTILTREAPAAVGPYAQGVAAGGFVFVSGQLPLDPATGELVPGDIKEQTARVMENIRAVLEAAGLDLDDVVKTTVFLRDINDFPAVNQVYAQYFMGGFPARSAVEVSGLPRGAAIEIEAVAWKRQG